jgi:hypothetical protein
MLLSPELTLFLQALSGFMAPPSRRWGRRGGQVGVPGPEQSPGQALVGEPSPEPGPATLVTPVLVAWQAEEGNRVPRESWLPRRRPSCPN